MTGIYYTAVDDWLRAIGITVHEVSGWQTRARSSGGFAAAPLGVQWHHTASSTSPQNDTNYMYFNADDAPIGNMLLARDGSAWLGAAGAANTAGKGGPLNMSRGQIPLDGANSRTWAIEAANNGVGEQWPQVQIDAYIAISNELNKRFGNKPTDVFNHQTWAPDRKIDPATAAAVKGPWKPASSTSSGTWRQSDVNAEVGKRAGGSTPPPQPPSGGGKYTVKAGDSWWSISQKYSISVDQLLDLNPPATSSTVIHPGDVLNVPGGSTPPPSTPTAPNGLTAAQNQQQGAAAPTPPASPVLKRGVRHPNVPWLQQVLCSMPQVGSSTPIFNPLWVGVDSQSGGASTAQLFGDATFNSLSYWQGRNDLTADGVYGSATASKMAKVRGK